MAKKMIKLIKTTKMNDITGIEIYNKTRLCQLYQEKGLTDETCKLLHLYFDAMCWLYGIITMRKAYEIFAEQNPGLITPEAFRAFVEIVRHEEHFYEILNESDIFVDGQKLDLWDWQLVEQSLLMGGFDDYIRLSREQEGKEFYIPERAEFLKYADEYYSVPTPQGERMFKYFCKHEKVDRARELFEEVELFAVMNERDIQYVLDDLDRMGWKLRSRKDLEEFLSLYTDLFNHTRLVENRGFTPAELQVASGLSGPARIGFGPHMVADLKSGKLDINDMREQICKMSFLSDECRQSMLDQLADMEGHSPLKPN
jgi:hypothetical protein